MLCAICRGDPGATGLIGKCQANIRVLPWSGHKVFRSKCMDHGMFLREKKDRWNKQPFIFKSTAENQALKLIRVAHASA